ncbi:hypothetical protein FCV25MIE_09158 [Fagus crenata]
MANATPESVSTVLHEDSSATKYGLSTHSHMSTVEIEILYPTQCQSVKTNSTQTPNLNSSLSLSHQPMARGPIPFNTQIEQNSKPHTRLKPLTNLEAHLSTTLPTDFLNTDLVVLPHPIPKPKWKRLARNNPIHTNPNPNLRLPVSSKRKTSDLSTPHVDIESCDSKQRRLNVSLGDVHSSSAVAARQSCRPQ